jgi:hypothetical protein
VSQFKHEEKFIGNAACSDALIGEYFDEGDRRFIRWNDLEMAFPFTNHFYSGRSNDKSAQSTEI